MALQLEQVLDQGPPWTKGQSCLWEGSAHGAKPSRTALEPHLGQALTWRPSPLGWMEASVSPTTLDQGLELSLRRDPVVSGVLGEPFLAQTFAPWPE